MSIKDFVKLYENNGNYYLSCNAGKMNPISMPEACKFSTAFGINILPMPTPNIPSSSDTNPKFLEILNINIPVYYKTNGVDKYATIEEIKTNITEGKVVRVYELVWAKLLSGKIISTLEGIKFGTVDALVYARTVAGVKLGYLSVSMLSTILHNSNDKPTKVNFNLVFYYNVENLINAVKIAKDKGYSINCLFIKERYLLDKVDANG